jgi:hypothetical protein
MSESLDRLTALHDRAHWGGHEWDFERLPVRCTRCYGVGWGDLVATLCPGVPAPIVIDVGEGASPP